MAEIKWIKITTDIFDDEKMKIIDKYPARDEILVVWFKLLSLAGKVNQSGLLFMSNKIPYTVDMLSAVFNREEKTIQMAMSVFQKFGMITVEDNEVISICNWDKHQNIDGMEKIREQSRVRMARSRANKDRLLLSDNKLRNGCVTVTDGYAIDKEKEEEEDKEKNKKKKVIRHAYGMYGNVLLSDEDHSKLLEEFPDDYQQRIERVSEYVASTGKSYKDFLATIRAWARKDKPATKKDNEWNFMDLEV